MTGTKKKTRDEDMYVLKCQVCREHDKIYKIRSNPFKLIDLPSGLWQKTDVDLFRPMKKLYTQTLEHMPNSTSNHEDSRQTGIILRSLHFPLLASQHASPCRVHPTTSPGLSPREKPVSWVLDTSSTSVPDINCECTNPRSLVCLFIFVPPRSNMNGAVLGRRDKSKRTRYQVLQ